MPAYLCNACDVIRHLPERLECPTCGAPPVEVDLALDVLVCPKCEHFESGRFGRKHCKSARCPSCGLRLTRINRAPRTDATGRRVPQMNPPPMPNVFLLGIGMGLVIDVLLAGNAAVIFGRAIPVQVKAEILIGTLLFAYVGWRFWRGFREIFGDARVRVNHAIEHATIKILQTAGQDVSWGKSTATGFYVAGDVSREGVERAAAEAISRLLGGETELRIDRCCGGRFFVEFWIVAGLAVVVPAAAILTITWPGLWPLLGVPPLLWLARGPLTTLLQRVSTTSARFKAASVQRVMRQEDAFYVSTGVTL